MNNQRLKVLIIEDDLDDAKLLGEMLTWSQESAFRVIHADGISHALVCLARDKIDIALLGLPSSGGEFLSDLHLLLTEAPNLPVVVMARPEDEAIAKEAVQAGAEDYLLKWQVDSRWVQRCLRTAAERRRRKDYAAACREASAGEPENAPTAISPRLREPLHLIFSMTDLLLRERLTPDQEKIVLILRGSARALEALANTALPTPPTRTVRPAANKEARPARLAGAGRVRSSNRIHRLLVGSAN